MVSPPHGHKWTCLETTISFTQHVTPHCRLRPHWWSLWHTYGHIRFKTRHVYGSRSATCVCNCNAAEIEAAFDRWSVPPATSIDEGSASNFPNHSKCSANVIRQFAPMLLGARTELFAWISELIALREWMYLLFTIS